MRIFLLSAMISAFVATVAIAETVNLNDGRAVEGKVMEKNAQSIKIEVNGVAMTYYADEIKNIDGVAFVAPRNASPLRLAGTPAAGASSAADRGHKRELILKFIEVFGTRGALLKNFDMMVGQMAKEKPDDAKKIRERIKVEEIIERLIPVYDRNFTAEDLKVFIAFYDSPQGRKLLSTIPVLMKESVAESVKYMEEKFPEAKQKE